MNCTNCGTAAKTCDNYSIQCGARLAPAPTAQSTKHEEPSKLDVFCAGLIEEWNGGRNGWLSLVKDVMAKDKPLINAEFTAKTDIGALDADKPQLFIFETVSGVTAEATLLAWQVEAGVGFAINEDQHYLTQDQGQVLFGALMQTPGRPAWLAAMQLVDASIRTGVMIDNECVAVVLSHYFMNDRRRTPSVMHAHDKILNMFLLYLQGLTFLGTARTFGDMKTVARIQETLGVSP